MSMNMQREPGEVFDFRGVTLQVKDIGCETSCKGCFFNECVDACLQDCIGFCLDVYRSDNKNVIFVKVKDSEKQEG